MDNGPIAAKAMALIGNITISHTDSYAVGNPQYSSKPATCPTINIPHTIIQLRKELLILKRLILHLLLSLAAAGRVIHIRFRPVLTYDNGRILLEYLNQRTSITLPWTI